MTVGQPDSLEIECKNNIINPTCPTGSDGSNEVKTSGGTPPYRLSLDNLSFSNDTVFSGLNAGSYTVYVLDDNDCLSQCEFEIINPEPETCEIQQETNLLCYGDSTATLSVSSTLDLAEATIVWSTGESDTQIIEKLSSGNYLTTITSVDGCRHTCQFEIEQPEELTLALIIYNDPTCFQGSNGKISIKAEGGKSPYQYFLTEDIHNTTGVFSELGSGNYQLTIIDSYGCNLYKEIELMDPDMITADIVAETELDCNDDADGRINLVSLNQEVSILWNTGDTTSYLQQLNAGDYFVTLTNFNGCNKVLTYNLPEPPPITYAVNTIRHNNCKDGSRGSIAILATGGTAPYTFAWSNGDTISQIHNLIAGNYTVTISDFKGCQEIADFEIEEPLPVVATFMSNPPTCDSSTDGRLELTISPDYHDADYLWNTGDTTANLEVSKGRYQVTVTTVPDCPIVFETEVLAPPPVSIKFSEYLPVFCYGEATGEVTIEINGGTSPYEIQWADGDFGLTRNNMAIGDYFVTVSDNNSCQMTESFKMLGPELPFVNIQSHNPLCQNSPTGSVSLESNINLATSNVRWNDGSTAIERTNLKSGVYSVTVTDNLGCAATAQITLTDPEPLEIVSEIKNIDCFQESTGEILLSVDGGTGPIDIIWSDSLSTDSASLLHRTKLATGNYTATITDANNCTLSETYTIHQSPEFTIQAVPITSCLDEKIPLTIAVNGREATEIDYVWTISSEDIVMTNNLITESNNNQIIIDTYSLPSGILSIACEATDVNGCKAFVSSEIILENCFDLALRKQICGPELKESNQPLIFEIDVYNQGTVTAYDLTIEDRFDSDFVFISTKNIASVTGNPSDWIQRETSVTTSIDSLLPGHSIQLTIYFDLAESPVKDIFCNEAEIISYSNRNRILPLDQDDTLSMPAVELDDDISDDTNGGQDNPYDDDQKDKATVRICPTYQHSVVMNECGISESNLLIDPQLISTLDPEGDGDGDSDDGDIGNLITSFHQTPEAAFANLAALQDKDYTAENIYARLVTQEGCISVVSFSFLVNELPDLPLLEEDIYMSLGDTIELSIQKKIGEQYQWQEKINGQFVDIHSATDHQYFIPITSVDQDNSIFRVEVTLEHENISCSQASNEVQLIIPSKPPACKNKLNVSLNNRCDLYLTPSQLTNSNYPDEIYTIIYTCLLYTSPSPRDATLSRMPSSA